VATSADFDKETCEKALSKAGYGVSTFEELVEK
jgi:hypothetical protein